MDPSKSKLKDEAFLNGKRLNPESLMMRYGYKPELSEQALKCPIFQTSTFVFKNAEEGKAFFELAYGLREGKLGEKLGLIYSRLNNPDLEILEDRLTLWDNAEACAVFPSGMAAISTTLLEFIKPGDTVLYTNPIYGGTHHFIKHFLTSLGIKSISIAAGMVDHEKINTILSKHDLTGKLAMIYLETPANPTNDLVDIAFYSSVAAKYSSKNRKVVLAVDNTFLGPLWQHPIKHGADLIIYSATKYIGGHSDVIAGVCLGSQELIDRIKKLRTFLGTIQDPWTGWLLLRSLETLKLRMTAQMENAKQVAGFLVTHPKIERVYYPGHLKEGDPQYGIYKKQC
ncbi:MAG: aminotransferase class I/II-fold pyridoxal phosphate-dependent enzyme, partial [Bdellovibrionota bacterium]